MLRAGPLSSEDVVRLANRRFVPFYFDLAIEGAAGDADARKFVVAARKDLGGGGVPTPPVLFMNAKGEVLGEVGNYATEAQVLDAFGPGIEAGADADYLGLRPARVPHHVLNLHLEVLELE